MTTTAPPTTTTKVKQLESKQQQQKNHTQNAQEHLNMAFIRINCGMQSSN